MNRRNNSHNLTKREKYLMKNIACILLTAVLIVTLCSCSLRNVSSGFSEKTDEEFANDRIKQVFNSIKLQDKDSLVNLFSTKAIKEAENIDAENLFSFIRGKVSSLKNPYGSPVVGETVDYGKVTKQLESWYVIETDETSYWIILFDYPTDQNDSENIGLYSMIVVETQYVEKLEGNWDNLMLPGIHLIDGQ